MNDDEKYEDDLIKYDLNNELKIFNQNLNFDNNYINPLSLKYLNDNALFQKKFYITNQIQKC